MKHNLERLIKQKVPFNSELLKAELGFMYVSSMLNGNQQHFFKAYGITPQQYNVLRILRGQFPNPANINLIKDRMIDRMSDASRIVDRLVKLDYVTKQPNSIDKRNADVMITEKALIKLKLIDDKMRENKGLLSNLSIDELNQLNLLIDRILDFI